MSRVYVAALAILQAVSSSAMAQAPAAEDALRRQGFELLDSRAAEFQMRLDEEAAPPLARSKAPILRWSNPVREFVNDGLTFLWLEGERPAAVVTVWRRSSQADLRQGELLHEFVTLSASPLILRRHERILWSPQAAAVANDPLSSEFAPGETRARRLSQMRDLARRFQATSYKMESPHELRLMPQPLYRYENSGSGIVDGALFAFAEGNDAEALLLLEALREADRGGNRWRYTLARMTSYRVVVRLDDREVFSVNPYWKGPRSPKDPYVEAFDGPFSLDADSDAPP
jgi:hypothetical protein